MKKEVINVSGAPNLPFSPAVRAGDYIFVSGQVGHVDADGNKIDDIEGQTRQCMSQMEKILVKAGASLQDVVKVTIFLGDVSDYQKMNDVYRTYFPSEPPARSTVIAGLAIPGMLVEIDCIAHKPQ
jgi:2-iminobutanoate/2-iminopropanoate deaminase